LNVSSQMPVSLHVFVDCLSDPAVDGFSIVLEDTLDVIARDVNSGQMVEVKADTSAGCNFPMSSGAVTFLDPLRSVAVSGTGLLPEKVTAGLKEVEALRVVLQHTGSQGESRALCSDVTVRVLDEAGHGLSPYGVFDYMGVLAGEDTLASVYITMAHTSDIYLPFARPILTGPGERDTLEILVDFDASAHPGCVQFHVNAQGIGIKDATDGSDVADLVGDFPLTSGIGRIVQPAEQIFFMADGMLPANLAAGEEAEIFNLHFDRDDSTGGSLVLVEGLTLDILDEDDRLADPSRVMEAIRFEGQSGEVSMAYLFQEGRIHVDFTDSPTLDAGESIDVILYGRTVERPDVSVFSVRINSSSDISCSDGTTGEPVMANSAEGSSYPYGSGRAALLKRDFREAFTNYPNPFVASSERTRITFYLPGDGAVTLKVFTINGRPVRTLLENDPRRTGLHQDVYWDGRNGRGDAVLNGVYFLMLKMRSGAREYVLKRKVAVIR
ncbi:MAG: hypothetical protein KAX38_03810, partial [Candidatus Krumholzibacteria bacterium]|nr:hypothetical protein [Candidatus Krumholzibacteria bacterium]